MLFRGVKDERVQHLLQEVDLSSGHSPPLLISMISSCASGQSPVPIMLPDPTMPGPTTLPISLCGEAVAIARASGLQ
ncbi:hypothetical protein EYF80_051520 [Liparis tanakae]|uniref:Uncharacterized protein n=1 Tax=Liparis tanakae TaxID=230148 RepID=A0A4Z2FAZ9_9TELE|nr:hypothetical protein EYF80_051520 [Liparis tanakae]